MTVSDGCEAGAAAFFSAAGLGFGAVRCARAIAGAAVRHEAAKKRERARKNDTDANLTESGRAVVTSCLQVVVRFDRLASALSRVPSELLKDGQPICDLPVAQNAVCFVEVVDG